MIKGSGSGLPRIEEPGGPLVSREVWLLMPIVLGVIGVPFLLTIIPLIFVFSLGLGTDVARAVFWSCAFTSYVILLPLAAGLVARRRERRQEIAAEMMAFFSSKIVALYSVSDDDSLAKDPRTAEAFEIYTQAERALEENPEKPLVVQEIIERGVALADEIMEEHRRGGEPRF